MIDQVQVPYAETGLHHFDKISFTGFTGSCQKSGIASDENFVKMTSFLFQWISDVTDTASI